MSTHKIFQLIHTNILVMDFNRPIDQARAATDIWRRYPLRRGTMNQWYAFHVSIVLSEDKRRQENKTVYCGRKNKSNEQRTSKVTDGKRSKRRGGVAQRSQQRSALFRINETLQSSVLQQEGQMAKSQEISWTVLTLRWKCENVSLIIEFPCCSVHKSASIS